VEADTWTAVETKSFVVDRLRVACPGSGVIKTFAPTEITVTFRPKIAVIDPSFYAALLTDEGGLLAGLDSKDFYTARPAEAGSAITLGLAIEQLPLMPGRYRLEVWLRDMATHLFEPVPQHLDFEVVETPIYGGRQMDHWFGKIAMRATAFERPA
ncbi:MAG TPA: hypothetical protein VG433_11045, partial [Pirellulales bacterium]|nr:hypothetical protein [Pirellulales bacterium]